MEAQLHSESCWVTLTYKDEFFPVSDDAWHRDGVLFMKRLRKSVAPVEVRSFGCRELGSQRLRPHFHACLFGVDFVDRVPWSRGHSGEMGYCSERLSALWKFGLSTVCDLSAANAGYTARYTVKKVPPSEGGCFRTVFHPVLQEFVPLQLCAPAMVSTHPGIGKAWFELFGAQAVEQGFVMAQAGVKAPVPAYFKKLAKRVDPLLGSQARADAERRYVEQRGELTDERLKVREAVYRARIREVTREGL